MNTSMNRRIEVLVGASRLYLAVDVLTGTEWTRVLRTALPTWSHVVTAIGRLDGYAVTVAPFEAHS